MYLSDGKKETQYIVKDIGLPTGIEKRLEALGMTRGTFVTVLNSKSKGILIVKVRGTRFALGRNITEHISVRDVMKITPAEYRKQDEAHLGEDFSIEGISI